MKKESIPGWKMNIKEVSNGRIKVILTDAYDRIAEVTDNATNETIERAISEAFDIEKKISKNWNLFLYDLSIQKLGYTEIQSKEYNDKVFGSWFIESNNNRLVYDGKDSWLIFQNKDKIGWTEIEIIKKEELKYSNFVGQLIRLTEKTSHSNS